MKTFEATSQLEQPSLILAAEQRVEAHFQQIMRAINHWYGKRLPTLFFVVGGKEVGKTALINHANIPFFTHEDSIKACPHTVESGQKLNWWFHQQAIFCELPAVYFTRQQSQVEKAIWQRFLQLLQKTKLLRKAQIILCINVEKFLQEDELYQQLTFYVKLAEDLLPSAKLNPIIYLTQSDQLLGFNEYHAQLSTVESRSVQGLLLSLSEQHAGSKVHSQFDKTLARMQQQVFSYLQNETDLHARILIHDFQAQWQQLKPACVKLVHYLQAIYQQHAWDLNSLWIYWGSAKQSRGKIDLLPELYAPHFQSEAMTASDYQTISRPYFIAGFFQELLQNFAGKPQAHDWLVRRRSWLFSILGAMLLGIALTMTYQLKKQVRHISVIHDDLIAYQMMANQADPKGSIAALLPPLNILTDARVQTQQLPATWDYTNKTRNLKQLRNKTTYLYHNALTVLVLPKLQQSLENILADAHPHNPNQLYAALQCYLMLAEPKHRDAALFKILYDKYILDPKSLSERDRRLWLQHVSALLQTDFPAQSIDLAAVQQSRSLLIQLNKNQLTAIFLEIQALTKNYPQFIDAQMVPLIYRFRNVAEFVQDDIPLAVKMSLKGNWVLGNMAIPADMQALHAMIHQQQQDYLWHFARVWFGTLRQTLLNSSISRARIFNEVVEKPDSPFAMLGLALHVNSQSQLQELRQVYDLVVSAQDHPHLAWQYARAYTLRQKDVAALFSPLTIATPLDVLSQELRAAALDSIFHATANDLNQQWHEMTEFYRKKLLNRFPFVVDEQRGTLANIEMVNLSDFQHYFSDTGLLAQFMQRVQPFLDTQQAVWQVKNQVPLNISTPDLLNLMHAQLIAKSFYQGVQHSLQVPLTLQLSELDSSVSQVVIDVYGTKIVDSAFTEGEATPPHHLLWAPLSGNIQLRLISKGGETSEQVWTGPWALFELLWQSGLQGSGEANNYVFTLDLDGHSAKYTLHTDSLLNPFVNGLLTPLQFSSQFCTAKN
jgi:type VI protein secretion system component VasK